MKKLQLLALAFMACFALQAQNVMNTGYLQITVNKHILKTEGGAAGVCTLDSATQNIYIHSGAGYKSISSVWDAVVGNWGLADGVGAMTALSDSTYTICMDLTPTTTNYYSNVNTANADSGILPVGTNIYNIGVVFRDAGPFPINPANGQPILNNNLKGAGPDVDARGQCSDIWLVGVNNDSIGTMQPPVQSVEEADIATIPAVTAVWVKECAASTNAVHDISAELLNNIIVSPNPFREQVNIQFNMIPDASKVQAQVYDVMGRVVADFTTVINAGYNNFKWNGAGTDGQILPAGTYLLKVTNGSKTETAKLIKI